MPDLVEFYRGLWGVEYARVRWAFVALHVALAVAVALVAWVVVVHA